VPFVSPKIRVVPAGALSRSARDEILALCRRAYGEDLRAALDSFEAPVHVLAIIDNAIVSHALWITRWLVPGERAPLRTAYVEAVATDPAFQRRGYASAVLQALIGEVEGFELAALCPSDEGQELYRRLGWEEWTGPLLIRKDEASVATPDEAIMIHRLPNSPPIHLNESMSAEWRPGEVW
jgi:aminoglycoside 2'-N-acetyltransferase I